MLDPKRGVLVTHQLHWQALQQRQINQHLASRSKSASSGSITGACWTQIFRVRQPPWIKCSAGHFSSKGWPIRGIGDREEQF